MANFWAGVGQGFSQGFEKSWDAAARRRERKEDREQALADAEDRRRTAREIAERARQNKLTDLKMQLERDAIKERQGQEAILESLSPEARKKALGDRLLFTGLQPETPAMLEGLDMGEVGRLDKYDTMTPSELQGTGLAGQRIEKELLAERVAEKAAERALELEERKLKLKTGAETEKGLNEIKNEIAEFEGRLGITTGATPSEGLQIPTGGERDIRRYHGELKEKVDDLDAMRPTYQAPPKEDKGTQPERAAAKMKILREEYNASGTTPERQGVLASEALGLLPLLYGQATQTHTIKDAEGFLQGKGLPPKPSTATRSEKPESPEALSKEETDHLNAARTMQRAKNLFMAQFGEKDAKKQLTIEGQLNHWVRNVAGAAAGLESWKDEEAAKFRAAADNLTAKALAQTHQMMGGGAFSEPDRILYERTIPTTKTFSPVNYMAKLKAWSEGLDDYVDYMSARQKIAGLPRLVSDMEPWQVMKFTDKKDDDGNVIISKGMAEMLIDHKLSLNPETNKTWTAEGLLDYQSKNAHHGFTKRDLLNFIALLPYEVKPPSYTPPSLPRN